MMRYFSKAVVVVALALGCISSASGQTFEPGYVVTSAGDTLRGQIENRFWQAPPENIVFRAAPTATAQTYLSSQVRAFRLESGRFFRAEVVPLDRGARTQTSNLPQRLVINSQPESILAEVLVDGPVTLLRAVPDGVTHYFVQRPGKPYMELTERKYLSVVGGREVIMDANNYRAQLGMYFGDCPAAVEAAGKSSYTAKSLVAVVQAFSTQCSLDKKAATEYLGKGKSAGPLALNAGLLGGGSYHLQRLKTSSEVDEEAPLLDGLNVDGKLHPVGGVYLDVLLPGRKWVGHSELTFSTFGRRGVFALAGGAGSYTWHGTTLDGRLGARYMFSQQPARAYFAGAGINLNFTTSFESGAQFGAGSSRVTARNVRVRTQSAFLGGPEFNASPYLEVGVRRSRFTFTLDAYLNGGNGHTDPLAVKTAFRDPRNPLAETSSYSGYNYRDIMVGFRALVAFRLVGQPD